MAEAFVNIVDVSKKIKRQPIVRPLSLQLTKGQVLALCGANGAGKSTVIRMIAGIAQPTAGRIEVGGLQWRRERKAYAEQLGYMPDDFQFGAALSAWETICFYASLRGIGKERAREVLEIVDLYEVRNKSIATFSKGMRQRLMFAQAILAAPKLLLMDEPTNGLDPYWMGMFVERVRELKDEGMTIIFSTHQLPVAEKCADVALFLHEGRVVSMGSVPQYMEQFGAGGLEKVYEQSVINGSGDSDEGEPARA